MMDRFAAVRHLIESSRDITNFADFGEGISDEWIDHAETTLGVALPESYKWWLRNYGGGEVGGEEIYSLYGTGLDEVAGGDIVRMHRLHGQEGRIPMCHSDIDGIFSFDLTQRTPDGELAIVSEVTGKIYAADFLDFLVKRIKLLSPN